MLGIRIVGQCPIATCTLSEHDWLGFVPDSDVERVAHDGATHCKEPLHGEHDRFESEGAGERVRCRPYRWCIGGGSVGELCRGGDESYRGNVPRHGDDDVVGGVGHAVHVVSVNAEADELAGGLRLCFEARRYIEKDAEGFCTSERHHHLRPVGGGRDGDEACCRLPARGVVERGSAQRWCGA